MVKTNTDKKGGMNTHEEPHWNWLKALIPYNVN